MQVNATPPLGQLGDTDLRLLRVFKSVVECGGMASAELELNIAMSTISRHVKDLETRLGLVLCRRGRSGFALTPEGEQVYEAALRLLAATDAFRGRLHDIHQRMGGELHLALFEKTASNPAAHIAEAVAQFRQLAPQATLHVHVGGIDSIEREDLAGLGYHSPNMALAHERRLERRATASDQEGVATLVLSGAFVGFLPDHYAEGFVRHGRLRVVSPEVLRYDCRFTAIVRQSPAPLRLTQAFLNCLQASHAGTTPLSKG